MTLSHIAHDCIIEDGVIFSNNVTLGGNTHVMKKSQLGFNVSVHQNQVIGSYSMIGMSSVITKKIKIIPGYIFAGNPAKKIAINKIGIKTILTNDSIKIFGNPNLKIHKNIVIKNFLKDHRVFMTSVIASLIFGGQWTIFDKDSIKTSFPSFLDKVSDLGAKII